MIETGRPGEPTGRSREDEAPSRGHELLVTRMESLRSEGFDVDPWILRSGEVYRAQASDEDRTLAVLRGSLHVTDPSATRTMATGEVLRIPRGVSHTLRAAGADDVYALVAHRAPPPIPPEAFEGGALS